MMTKRALAVALVALSITSTAAATKHTQSRNPAGWRAGLPWSRNLPGSPRGRGAVVPEGKQPQHPADKKGGKTIVRTDGDRRRRTPLQPASHADRAYAYLVLLVNTAAVVNALSHMPRTPEAFLATAAAGVAAPFAVDLVSGLVHKALDDLLTGPVAADFQDHHRHPRTITHIAWEANVRRSAEVFLPPSIALALWQPGAPGTIFGAAFFVLGTLAQQLHAEAHRNPTETHPALRWLQEAGIIISPREHGKHHQAPYDTNHAIFSGHANRLLDRRIPGHGSLINLLDALRWRDGRGSMPNSWLHPKSHIPASVWRDLKEHPDRIPPALWQVYGDMEKAPAPLRELAEMYPEQAAAARDAQTSAAE